MAEIFKYLNFKDLISLKKLSTEFHHAIVISLRAEVREVSLRCFGSVEETKAFFRDTPITIVKLDMAFSRGMGEVSKTKFLSRVLNGVELGNVTDLAIDGLKNHAFFKQIMAKFTSVRSITLNGRIEEINIGMESIAATAIEEISINALSNMHLGMFNSYELTGVTKFRRWLRKHGPSLRAFAINGDFSESDLPLIHIILTTLSAYAPNLESFKFHSDNNYVV